LFIFKQAIDLFNNKTKKFEIEYTIKKNHSRFFKKVVNKLLTFITSMRTARVNIKLAKKKYSNHHK